ncbi:MAG: LLM class flavin-dependent oxidoreductase [Pseudomonadales bacterium]|nr:LLM class flavin-dependent oxidoreductase [Pseudomonadales bacterium]
MDVGLQLIFTSYGWDNGITDSEVYAQEIDLAIRAEALGFDCIWPTEHHFFDYSFCPDNLQLLSYLAGRLQKINLGTAAVILPWNDPLRVAEKVAMLDELSSGRVRFGMGRGLSRREFQPFRGIEMAESRERFDEAAPLIVEALRTGVFEGNGRFYPTSRAEIRPRPSRSFDGRVYAVANSADSLEACARIGARMILFSEARWEKRLENINKYRERFRELHDREPQPVMTADFTFCHHDAGYAQEVAERCMARYLQSLLEHYELMNDHLLDVKGYQGYGRQAGQLQSMGFDKYLSGFLAANAYGTPEQMLEKFRQRREIIGDYELATCFRFGGMTIEDTRESMALFAREVMPELRRW